MNREAATSGCESGGLLEVVGLALAGGAPVAFPHLGAAKLPWRATPLPDTLPGVSLKRHALCHQPMVPASPPRTCSSTSACRWLAPSLATCGHATGGA